MDIFEFFTNYSGTIMFIFYSFMLLICGYFLGRMFGSLDSIKNDFKSLDYDNLLRENEQLRDVIEIKKKK